MASFSALAISDSDTDDAISLPSDATGLLDMDDKKALQEKPRNYFVAARFGGLICLGIVLLTYVIFSLAKQPSNPRPSTVILISIDGFNPIYNNLNVTPTLQSLISTGTSAKYMLPSFPSITFPNHYTIATGLYPESTGMIANQFYDIKSNRSFSSYNTLDNSDPYWWRGDAIWTTAERAGLISATMMWPGSELRDATRRASFYQKYDGSMSMLDKIDQIFRWIDTDPSNPVRFITLYNPEVDAEGHARGTHGVLSSLKVVDLGLSKLLRELDLRNMRSTTDIVLVSDHGMTDTSPARIIIVDDLKVDLSLLFNINNRALLFIYPKSESDTLPIYTQLSLDGKNKNFTTYLKSEIPARFLYNQSSRIPPILLIADLGWIFVNRGGYIGGGSHGYDPAIPDMHAIFVANGPSFAKGRVVEPFQNIEVYQLLCDLLKISASPNNGTGISLIIRGS